MSVRLAFVLIGPALVLALAAGCAASHPQVQPSAPHVAASAGAPPPPTTWPAYPRFSHRSCWTRPFLRGELKTVEQVAPSYAPAPVSHPVPPATVARRLLARLGDRRYVHSITFAPAEPAVGHAVHALYAGGHPPRDALTARVVSSDTGLRRHPTPEQSLTSQIASWESGLVAGALRDDMCAQAERRSSAGRARAAACTPRAARRSNSASPAPRRPCSASASRVRVTVTASGSSRSVSCGPSRSHRSSSSRRAAAGRRSFATSRRS